LTWRSVNASFLAGPVRIRVHDDVPETEEASRRHHPDDHHTSPIFNP
jgi:hypothetical protein